MAASVSNVQAATVPGAEVRTINTVTLDNSYAEGGESLTANQLGLGSVTYAQCNVTHGTESSEVRGIAAYYTPSTAKIHVIDSATGKEVAKEKDLSKVTVQVVAYGTLA
jgi:hypothetical protein